MTMNRETLADIWLRGDSQPWDSARQLDATGTVWLLTRWHAGGSMQCRAKLMSAEVRINNRVRVEFQEVL